MGEACSLWRRDRNFLGAEINLIFPHVTLYGYGLVQKDETSECPEDATQNYTYDSEYIGLGIDAGRNNFSYRAEIIKEYGKSYTDATKARLAVKDVDAWSCRCSDCVPIL